MSNTEAELLKKRQRLEELKLKKATRDQQKHDVVVQKSAALDSKPAFLEDSASILKSVGNLLNGTAGASNSSAPASPSQHSGPNATRRSNANVTLTVARQPEQTVASENRITFDTHVQTDESEHGRWQSTVKPLNRDGEEDDELDRMRLRETALQQRVDTFLREKQEFEHLKVTTRLEEEKEQQRNKPLTASERESIQASSEFLAFLERSSKMVERQLCSQEMAYDFTKNYADPAEEAKADKVITALYKKVVLADPSKSGRAVTSIDWSPKFPELLLCSLAGQEDALSQEPDGTVLVWNMHMPSRPEFVFFCQSAVLSAHFHPTNASLIIGSTVSGQVVMWDSREAKKSPVHRTLLARGHVYPVFSLASVAKANKLYDVISLSTDGNLCVWGDDNLHEPKLELDLKQGPLTAQMPELCNSLSPPCFAAPTRGDNTSILLGADDGNVYRARIRADKREKMGVEAVSDLKSKHTAPVTNVTFQPTYKQMSAELALSSSLDWTIKLWNCPSKDNSTQLNQIHSFGKNSDSVLDVQWAPAHPGLFASCDSSGTVQLWNLLTADFESPIYSTGIEEKNSAGDSAAVTKLKWAHFSDESDETASPAPEDGSAPSSAPKPKTQQFLACGTSMGSVHVYVVSDSVTVPPPGAVNSVADIVRRLTKS